MVGDLSLNGTWELRAADWTLKPEGDAVRIARLTRGWISARVPGEVHLDLVRGGMMPEPLVGDNAKDCRWPETKCWWYRRTFNVSAGFISHERQRIVFDGLDLHAWVFLNGSFIGTAANAFVPAAFDVKPFLQKGHNELLLCLTAGSELAKDAARSDTDPDPGWNNPAATGNIPNPVKEGELHSHRIWPGHKWLRKPAFSYGWDWIEPLPNIGITRDVRLEGRSHAVVSEIRLDTIRRDKRLFLETEAVVENLHPWSERAAVLEICIDPPGKEATPIRRRYALALPVGRSPVRDLIEVPDARLWWPNGMGDQPLYHVTTLLLHDDTECDRREMDIGLRTIEIDRTTQTDGSRFCLRVNDEPVFCKGANWGPADAFLPRVNRKKYEHLVAEAQEAHFNMFRVNGVGTYEYPAFYEACDRAGILIWQDFTLSCSTYPDYEPEFRNAVRDEAEQIVASLRHHPCIAFWCGSNENIWGFADWWNPDKAKPPRIGGSLLYNQVLPDVCRHLDPHRLYWPCSPFGGDSPNAENAGDCHWWIFMNPDKNRWITHGTYDECRARFVSEFGAVAPCHLDSIRQYLPPDDRRLDSLACQRHTNMIDKGKTAEAIRFHYTDPEGLSLAEYVLYGQMVQAQLLGRAVESFRFRKNDRAADCQGALVWSYSDCWGETGWSIIDYYGRRKASYYWYRRACKPVKVIVRRRGDMLITRVVNDTLGPVRAAVEFGWFRVDGTQRRTRATDVAIAPNGVKQIGSDRISNREGLDPREWVYGAILRSSTGDDQCIWPLVPHRELAMPAAALIVTPTSNGCEIVGPVYCHGVHFNDHGRALLSDNYLDLLPGVLQKLTWVNGKGKLPAMQGIKPGGQRR